ncbi:sigma factor-like helix-turn-helix DNA-binding protein [Actinomycetospora corticicola]|uniref:Putative RNA polymerase sigma factor n=1 Tax=Actinomycetospora corticicola TaxID=663602 RepID=A0A7Y9DYU1_9PSEU|nr:putative RNA polymerase sigma factor [Actinomycetospora corticicola]
MIEALREAAPVALAVLVRRHRDFDACEDALQEALLAASRIWAADGVPDNPTGWLVTTATRRLVEGVRRDTARRRREEADARRASEGAVGATDDTLALLLLCCHPALRVPSQVALTLRAVGGLTTAEIARGLLLPEPTVAQRISRAKARLTELGRAFEVPDAGQRRDRLPAVLAVLSVVFTEGHTASAGETLQRTDLADEAIRLARVLAAALEGAPEHGEAAGLLALMLLTDARRAARTGPDGGLVPLAEQDRTRWDPARMAEGTALVTAVLRDGVPGPYTVQAAIAAVHAEAGRAQDTDWPQVLALYDTLVGLWPDPMARLGRLVALGEVHGPAAALAELDALDEPGLRGHHRVAAVRAHLAEAAGRPDEAVAAYREAARRTASAPERAYLLDRASRVGGTG